MPANIKENAIADFDKKVAEARAKLVASDRLTQAFEFKFEPPTDLTVPAELKATLPRPQIVMSAMTYLKMLEYVLKINIECAWHGFVTRNNNIFAITDVKMYPHKGKAAFVESDEDKLYNQKIITCGVDTTYPTIEKYEAWKLGLTVEQELSLRFQAHSHVNMGTSPSGTDMQNQKDFMNDIINFIETNPAATESERTAINPFYIFAIMNKRQEINWFLYDYETGVLFEKEDLDFSVIFKENFSMDTLTQEIKDNHSTASYSSNTPAYNYNYGYNYSSHAHDDYEQDYEEFDRTDWRDNYNYRNISETPHKDTTPVTDKIYEIKCTTEESKRIFMQTQFYITHKELMFAHTDPNFAFTFFYALDDEAAKKIPFEMFRQDSAYKTTSGITLAKIARPKWYPSKTKPARTSGNVSMFYDKRQKRMDKCLEKIENWMEKNETPYILIDTKRAQFDVINKRNKDLMEFIGDFVKITFKNGQEKECFCIKEILCIEDEHLECILDLQDAGFSFKSIKLEEKPLNS